MTTALITGASQVLGLALARAYAARGDRLVIDARRAGPLAEAAAELGRTTEVVALRGDVTDPDHRADLAAAVGVGLDVLVHNASALGPVPLRLLADLDAGALAAVLATNLVAPQALSMALLPTLLHLIDTRLVSRGIRFAPVVLHTGVSSQKAGEGPQPERFAVTDSTAALVNATVEAGGRVIGVGTSATRALESAVDAGPGGPRVRARSGWTERVLTPKHPPRVVRGLLTGWHDALASHLLLVESVAGPAPPSAPMTRPWRTAIAGTSSATPACCCPDAGL